MNRSPVRHWMLVGLAVAGLFLAAGPVSAQRWTLFNWSGHYPSIMDWYGYTFSPPPSRVTGNYSYNGVTTPEYGNVDVPQPSWGTTGYQSFYSPQSGGVANSANSSALINVSAPSGARIRFNNAPTASTGASLRTFVSPPLSPGYDYSYEVSATWMRNGQPVTASRRVVVHAGQVVNVAFGNAANR